MKTTVKILCIGMAIIGFVACTKKSSVQSPYVEITGTAEKEIDPDIFYLNFNLNEPDKTKKNDINAMEQRMLSALKSLGIDTKNNLTLTDISADGWYWWRRSNRPVYQSKSYLLKIGNLDLTNRVCDKLDSLKVDYSLAKVDYSKMDELKQEVQREAVKNARMKAENLLSGEKREVGELISLQEQETFNTQAVREYMQFDKSANEANYETPPAFRKMKVSYSVVARFGVK